MIYVFGKQTRRDIFRVFVGLEFIQQRVVIVEEDRRLPSFIWFLHACEGIHTSMCQLRWKGRRIYYRIRTIVNP